MYLTKEQLRHAVDALDKATLFEIEQMLELGTKPRTDARDNALKTRCESLSHFRELRDIFSAGAMRKPYTRRKRRRTKSEAA